MSAFALETVTVKSLAAPSAWMALAAGAVAGLAAPAVPVNTSTLPASADAVVGAAGGANQESRSERGQRSLSDTKPLRRSCRQPHPHPLLLRTVNAERAHIARAAL